jgi:hypothetical protein
MKTAGRLLSDGYADQRERSALRCVVEAVLFSASSARNVRSLWWAMLADAGSPLRRSCQYGPRGYERTYWQSMMPGTAFGSRRRYVSVLSIVILLPCKFRAKTSQTNDLKIVSFWPLDLGGDWSCDKLLDYGLLATG